MRIRTTKPEFYTSEDMARLPIETRFIFQAVWSYVDDNGVGRASVKLMDSDIFPLADDPHVSRMQIACSLQQLVSAGHVVVYEVNSRAYIEVINWNKHQYIARPNKPRYPSYNPGNSRKIPLDIQCACEVHVISLSGTGEQGNRGTEEQGKTNMPNGSAAARVIEAEVIDPEPEPKAPTEPDRFEEFWVTYPRKVGKQKAIAKFKAASKRATQQEVIDGANALANDPNLPEPRFIPHPTTWLERNGWEDEALPAPFNAARNRSTDRMLAGYDAMSGPTIHSATDPFAPKELTS